MGDLDFKGWCAEGVVEMVRIYRETHGPVDDYNAVSAVCQDIPLPDWQVDHLADAAFKLLESSGKSIPCAHQWEASNASTENGSEDLICKRCGESHTVFF